MTSQPSSPSVRTPQPPPRPQTPAQQASDRLQAAFTTPPPRSVPMERTPPSPFRNLCLDCAQKAFDYYERAHKDHVEAEHMGRQATAEWPTPPPPHTPRLPSRGQFDAFMGAQTPTPAPQESQTWLDPYDGVM